MIAYLQKESGLYPYLMAEEETQSLFLQNFVASELVGLQTQMKQADHSTSGPIAVSWTSRCVTIPAAPGSITPST